MNERELTGFPSVDKPWLKYYSEEAIRAPLPECTAYEMIRRGNEGHGEDVALIYYGRKVTYAQLFAEIEKAAKAFAALGIGCGDVVVLCSVNMPETVYAFYALDRLGAIANFVDPRTDLERMRSILTECEAKLVLTVDLAYPLLRKASAGTAVEKIVLLSPADSLPPFQRIAYRMKNKAPMPEGGNLLWGAFIAKGAGTEPRFAPYEKGRCLAIMHTGGTTGIPKGVMLSDDCFNAVAHGYRYIDVPFERQHKYFDDLPPFYTYGLSFALHTMLSNGLQVILYPKFDPYGFPKIFKKYKPNHFAAGATHLKSLSLNPLTRNLDLSFLVTAAAGGDKLNEKTEETVNAYFRRNGCHYATAKGYGMTELCASAVTTIPKANEIGSVGIPLVSNNVKIVDADTDEELGYDEVGEIRISGPSLMLGYYKNPKETENTIVTEADGTRWIKTGDLGRINRNGLLFHEGRIRRIYVTTCDNQPAKIFPGMIENAVKELPDVYDCTVVGRCMKNSAYYESVAYVIAHKDHKPFDALTEELKAVCEEKLPAYARPVEYQFLEEFPRTPIGKVDFRVLERKAAEERND